MAGVERRVTPADASTAKAAPHGNLSSGSAHHLAALAIVRDRGGHGKVQHLSLGREAEAGVLAQPLRALLESRRGLALRHEPVRAGGGGARVRVRLRL